MDKVKQLEKVCDCYRESLKAVADQRERLKVKLGQCRSFLDHFYANYHLTRRALIDTRLRLRDAEVMIDGLLKEGKPRPPDIEIL
jgi:hypothetical protein